MSLEVVFSNGFSKSILVNQNHYEQFDQVDMVIFNLYSRSSFSTSPYLLEIYEVEGTNSSLITMSFLYIAIVIIVVSCSISVVKIATICCRRNKVQAENEETVVNVVNQFDLLRQNTSNVIAASYLSSDIKKFVTLNLKTKRYNEEDSEKCTICFDIVKLNEEVCDLKCKHVFHYVCLKNWLITAPQLKCPNCNLIVFQQPEEPVIQESLFRISDRDLEQSGSSLSITDRQNREGVDEGMVDNRALNVTI